MCHTRKFVFMCYNNLVTCFCIGIWKILARKRWICRRLWSFPCFISKFCGRWFIHKYRFPAAVNSGISSCRLSFYSPFDVSRLTTKDTMFTFYWSLFCFTTLCYISLLLYKKENSDEFLLLCPYFNLMSTLYKYM